MNSEIESRIRKWHDAQLHHPGRRQDRETIWNWVDELLKEVDNLRIAQVKKP